MTRENAVDYILCEGYQDRAFWSGLLQYLGWQSLRGELDLLRRAVRGHGRFLFRKVATQRDIIVMPYDGVHNLANAAKNYLKGDQPGLGRLILNLDSDDEDGVATGSALARVKKVVQDAKGKINGEHGPHEVAGISIWPVIWSTPAIADMSGLPAKETLEKLIVLAFNRVHPERGAAVQEWLEQEPRGEKTHGKSFAFTHFAKWHARDLSAEHSYEAPWRDPLLAKHLVEILEATGAWKSILAFDAD